MVEAFKKYPEELAGSHLNSRGEFAELEGIEDSIARSIKENNGHKGKVLKLSGFQQVIKDNRIDDGVCVPVYKKRINLTATEGGKTIYEGKHRNVDAGENFMDPVSIKIRNEQAHAFTTRVADGLKQLVPGARIEIVTFETLAAKAAKRKNSSPLINSKK